MKSTIVILCLSIFPFLFADESGTNPGFVESHFQDGIPNGFSYDWPNAIFASIESDTFYKAIYLIFEDQTEFPTRGYISIINPNGSSSHTNIGFKHVIDNIYRAEAVIKTTTEDELVPLNLIIKADKRLYNINGEKVRIMRNQELVKNIVSNQALHFQL